MAKTEKYSARIMINGLPSEVFVEARDNFEAERLIRAQYGISGPLLVSKYYDSNKINERSEDWWKNTNGSDNFEHSNSDENNSLYLLAAIPTLYLSYILFTHFVIAIEPNIEKLHPVYIIATAIGTIIAVFIYIDIAIKNTPSLIFIIIYSLAYAYPAYYFTKQHLDDTWSIAIAIVAYIIGLGISSALTEGKDSQGEEFTGTSFIAIIMTLAFVFLMLTVSENPHFSFKSIFKINSANSTNSLKSENSPAFAQNQERLSPIPDNIPTNNEIPIKLPEEAEVNQAECKNSIDYNKSRKLSRYIVSINKKLIDEIKIIENARRDLEAGEGSVGFLIDPNGRLLDVKICRYSGSQKVDEVSIAAVKNAAPYPSLHDGKAHNILFNYKLSGDSSNNQEINNNSQQVYEQSNRYYQNSPTLNPSDILNIIPIIPNLIPRRY